MRSWNATWFSFNLGKHVFRSLATIILGVPDTPRVVSMAYWSRLGLQPRGHVVTVPTR